MDTTREQRIREAWQGLSEQFRTEHSLKIDGATVTVRQTHESARASRSWAVKLSVLFVSIGLAGLVYGVWSREWHIIVFSVFYSIATIVTTWHYVLGMRQGGPARPLLECHSEEGALWIDPPGGPAHALVLEDLVAFMLVGRAEVRRDIAWDACAALTDGRVCRLREGHSAELWETLWDLTRFAGALCGKPALLLVPPWDAGALNRSGELLAWDDGLLGRGTPLEGLQPDELFLATIGSEVIAERADSGETVGWQTEMDAAESGSPWGWKVRRLLARRIRLPWRGRSCLPRRDATTIK